MIKTLLVLVCLSLASSAFAQTPVKNPSGVAFICPDHATDDQHEIDIVRASDNVVVQTILGGDPPLVGTEVIIKVNVQPVAMGQYRFVVRAVQGGVKSDAGVSGIWERAPGRPTNVDAR